MFFQHYIGKQGFSGDLLVEPSRNHMKQGRAERDREFKMQSFDIQCRADDQLQGVIDSGVFPIYVQMAKDFLAGKTVRVSLKRGIVGRLDLSIRHIDIEAGYVYEGLRFDDAATLLSLGSLGILFEECGDEGKCDKCSPTSQDCELKTTRRKKGAGSSPAVVVKRKKKGDEGRPDLTKKGG